MFWNHASFSWNTRGEEPLKPAYLRHEPVSWSVFVVFRKSIGEDAAYQKCVEIVKHVIFCPVQGSIFIFFAPELSKYRRAETVTWPRNLALERNSVLQIRQPWTSSSFSRYSVCFDKTIYISRRIFSVPLKWNFSHWLIISHWLKNVYGLKHACTVISQYTSGDGLPFVAYREWTN